MLMIKRKIKRRKARYKMEKTFILRIFSVILFLECFFDNDYDLTDKGNLSIM